jgi:hypothetical protein
MIYFVVIALFSSNFKKFNTFRPFYEKREITPKWVKGFTSKLQGG